MVAEKLQILIGNDDGIESPGIQALANALSEIATVYVAAPNQEKSGASHGISVGVPLEVESYPFPAKVAAAWRITGTPADCMKIALEELCKGIAIDLVVAGINRGPNLGTDVFYSGTIAAAFEGFILGYPALAASIDSFAQDYDYNLAANLCKKVVLWWQKQNFLPKVLFNLNTPAILTEETPIHLTTLGKRLYQNVFTKTERSGKTYYTMGGNPKDDLQDQNSDVYWIKQQCATITPLSDRMLSVDHYDVLQKLALAGKIF